MQNADTDAASRHFRPLVVTSVVILVVLGAFAFWQGKPLYRWVLLQRALRHLDDVETLLAEGNMSLAYSKASQAYQLAPNEPRIIRAAARVTMAAESPQALPLLERLVRMGEATFEDRRDLAFGHLLAGNTSSAASLCQALLEEKPNDRQLLEIAMDIRVTAEELPEALDVANKLMLLDPGNLEQRLRVAFVSLSQGDEIEIDRAQRYLCAVAREGTEDGIRALSLLLSQGTPPPHIQREVIEIIADHPLKNERLAVEALSYSLNLDPLNRQAIIENAMEERRDWPPHELALFAQWLAGQGESSFILENFELETVLKTTALLGPYLDALSSQEKFDEVESILARDGLPISAVTQQAYRALCAQLGRKDPDNAREHLRKALAVIERFGSFSEASIIGQTSEMLNHLEVAESAYELALRANVEGIINHAHSKLLELAEKGKNARKIREVATRYFRLYPHEKKVFERYLYLNHLLGIEIEATLQKTLTMIEAEPTRAAPRLIAALAYYRMHDYTSAAEMCDPCDPRELSPGFRTVYAAIAAATNRPELALEIGAAIATAELLDEEKLLLSSALATPAGS